MGPAMGPQPLCVPPSELRFLYPSSACILKFSLVGGFAQPRTVSLGGQCLARPCDSHPLRGCCFVVSNRSQGKTVYLTGPAFLEMPLLNSEAPLAHRNLINRRACRGGRGGCQVARSSGHSVADQRRHRHTHSARLWAPQHRDGTR